MLTFEGTGKFIAIGLLVVVAVVYAVNRPAGSGGTLAGLTIVRIDSRSAGTYDGAFSARVTIYNGAGAGLRHVNAKGTCTNAAGAVVGTSSAKAPDLAAGETTAIDMTFPKAVGCKIIHVEAEGRTL